MPHGVGGLGPTRKLQCYCRCELDAKKKEEIFKRRRISARGMFFTRDPVERIMLTLETSGFAG